MIKTIYSTCHFSVNVECKFFLQQSSHTCNNCNSNHLLSAYYDQHKLIPELEPFIMINKKIPALAQTHKVPFTDLRPAPLQNRV